MRETEMPQGVQSIPSCISIKFQKNRFWLREVAVAAVRQAYAAPAYLHLGPRKDALMYCRRLQG